MVSDGCVSVCVSGYRVSVSVCGVCLSVCHLCLCVHMGACEPVCAGEHGGQKGDIKLELQALVSHTIWMLGARVQSSDRAVGTLASELSLQPQTPFIKGNRSKSN